MPIFRGEQTQRGYGLGSVLTGLFKSATPLLKKGAASLGRTLLKTGVNVAKDALQGKNVKDSVVQHSKDVGKGLVRKLVDETSSIAGPKVKRARKRVKKKAARGSSSSRSKKSGKRRRNQRPAKDIFS